MYASDCGLWMHTYDSNTTRNHPIYHLRATGRTDGHGADRHKRIHCFSIFSPCTTGQIGTSALILSLYFPLVHRSTALHQPP